jgi:hypothetical protein
MTEETARQVKASRATVAKFETRRNELIRAFLHDLPDDIEAGAVTPANFLRHDGAGWHAADESPTARHESVEALYAARLESLTQSPLGPWTVAQYRLMRAALDQPEYSQAAAPQARTRLISRIDGLIAASSHWAADKPRLSAAMTRYAADTTRDKDVKAVEKFYSDAYDHFQTDRTSRAWIEAAIHKGSASLPSWDELRAIKKGLERAYNKSALRGIAGFFAGLAAVFALNLSPWPLAAQLAGFAALMSPMVWAMFSIWRRDSMGWSSTTMDFDMIRDSRRRTFGDD